MSNRGGAPPGPPVFRFPGRERKENKEKDENTTRRESSADDRAALFSKPTPTTQKEKEANTNIQSSASMVVQNSSQNSNSTTSLNKDTKDVKGKPLTVNTKQKVEKEVVVKKPFDPTRLSRKDFGVDYDTFSMIEKVTDVILDETFVRNKMEIKVNCTPLSNLFSSCRRQIASLRKDINVEMEIITQSAMAMEEKTNENVDNFNSSLKEDSKKFQKLERKFATTGTNIIRIGERLTRLFIILS